MGLTAVEREMEGIPSSVLAQDARADELQRQRYGTPERAPDPEGTPQADPTPAPREDPNSETYKHRFEVLQGKYNKEVRERQSENAVILGQNKQLQDQLTMVIGEIQKLKETKPVETISEKEKLLQTDFSDVDAGVDAKIDRKLASFEQRIISILDEKLGQVTTSVKTEIVQDKAKTAYERYLETLTKAIPTWRIINKDPRFIDWLGKTERYAGKTRFDMLNEAHNRMDAETVLTFFDDFLKETGTTPRPQPHPNDSGSGGHRGGGEPTQYTEGDLKELYNKVRRGILTEEEAAPLEQKITMSLRKQKGLS